MKNITKYKNIITPKVSNTISLESLLKTIKNGDDNLPLIDVARTYGKGHIKYDEIKKTLLPTFRINFLFRNLALNTNIANATGYIYIDVDDAKEIPKSDYIFAYWKSLSNTGYGLVAKVENLTLENFKYVYDDISKLIGVTSDNGARKATQQTVLSYDRELYHNPNSTTYIYIENTKKVSSPINLKKKNV